jgi:hypothetical protein
MPDGLREGHQIGNSCSAAVYFTAAAKQQVVHMTTVNCFCLGGYSNEFHTEADSCSSTYDDDDDDNDWIWLGPEDFYFSSFVCVESNLETSGFDSTDDLCYDMGGESIGEDGKLHEHDLQPLPSFTKTHCLRNCYIILPLYYVHSISKHDQQNILNLELAVFCPKQKV